MLEEVIRRGHVVLDGVVAGIAAVTGLAAGHDSVGAEIFSPTQYEENDGDQNEDDAAEAADHYHNQGEGSWIRYKKIERQLSRKKILTKINSTTYSLSPIQFQLPLPQVGSSPHKRRFRNPFRE